MKKSMKTLIFGFLAMFFVLTLTSCGDESEDPQPQKQVTEDPKTEDPKNEEPVKTNLELVKTGIVGTWELQSIVVTHGDLTQTFNGGCDESGYTQAIKANLEDIDFKFAENGKVSLILNCQGKTIDETYTVTETNSKFLVETSNGWKFELMTPASDLEKNTIQVNCLSILQNVDKIVWTFKLK